MTLTGGTAVGVYKGICTNNSDPEGLYRIKAICPQVFGDPTTQTDWALPAFPPGGVSLPVPSQGVWLAFEGGDINYPIWFGVWQDIGPGVFPGQPTLQVGVPVGGVIEWYSDTLPVSGGSWAFMDGSPLQASSYPILAAVYPNWVNVGTGIITLPDTRDRVSISAGHNYVVGSIGGTSTVTLAAVNIPRFNSVPVTFSGLGHNHGGSAGGSGNTGNDAGTQHSHSYNQAYTPSNVGLTAGGSSYGLYYGQENQNSGFQSINHSHTMSLSVTIGNDSIPSASGTVSFGQTTPTAITTVQPYIAARKVIRVA